MPQLLRRFVSGRHGLVCGLLAVAAVAVAPPAAVAASAQSDNHFANADGLIRAGDIPGAVIELEKAIDADPGNLEAWLALGKSRIWLGAPRQAEATLLEARERGLAEARMIVPLAQALLMQAKFDEVLGDIRSGKRGGKVEGEILLIRGQAQMNLGLIDDAETSLRRATGLRPDDPRPKIVLAQLLISKGALSAAERLAEASLLLAPQASEVWVLKGELRRLADDLDGAFDYFSRALDIDPNDMAARLDRAASLIDLDRDAEAASDLEAILRYAPNHPPTLYLTALLAAKRKEYKAAEAALGAGGRQLRDHLPSIFLRASIFYAQDRLDEAAALFRSDPSADSLVSCIRVPHIYHPRSVMRHGENGYLVSYLRDEMLTRRQEKDPVYARNGPAICITRTERLSEFVFGGQLIGYEMDEASSVDIDDLDDFARAERMLSERARMGSLSDESYRRAY